MKRQVNLNLPDDFVLTSELLNISLKKTLETIIRNVKIYDFLDSHVHAKRSSAKEIFKRFLHMKGINGERILRETAHANSYIPCIQSLVKIESGVKALEYKATVNAWLQEIYQGSSMDTTEEPMITGEKFCIKTTEDFEVLCKLFQVEPDVFLQYYIDRISLPKKCSMHPEDPKGVLMEFFQEYTPSEDSAKLKKYLEKNIQGIYHYIMITIVKADNEQPECEALLRVEIAKWRDEYMMLRRQWQKQGKPLNITSYGS